MGFSQIKRSGVALIHERCACFRLIVASANDFHAKAISDLVSSGTSSHIGRCYTEACELITLCRIS